MSSKEEEKQSTSPSKKEDTENTTNSSTNSKNKKRTLKEIDSDCDANDTDEDLDPPSPVAKKRKLNDENDTETGNKESETETPTKCTKDIKICCYNLNGVRAAAKHGLEDYITQEDADIVCFSEMKAKKSQNPCKFKGYEIVWNECTAKAGYAGTAVLTKTKPISIQRGIGSEDDSEGRAITLEFDAFYLVNTYVPNSGQNLKFKQRRLKWDKAMKEWLKALQDKKPVIWTGDLNVAILDFDVYDGETNKNRCKSAGFTPYERDNFGKILADLKLVDGYRALYPKEREKHFTFFTKRSRGADMKKTNKGWRLDYFVVSESLRECMEDVQIRNKINCSDHVPLILTMKQ